MWRDPGNSPAKPALAASHRRALPAISIVALVSLVVVAVRCSYPDFRYEEETEEGSGGDGGNGPASSSSSSGPVAQVSCGDGMATPQIECQPGEVCCFHLVDAAQDHCGAMLGCGAGFTELSCNTGSDCPPQAPLCCAKDNENDGAFDIITCQGSCQANNELVMCGVNRDCVSLLCEPIDYPGYSACAP